MEIEFERIALYEEVWSTPLTKLGEKYGMSDNGIRKVCKAMNIPLPKVGHWAKVEAGQEVTRTELPEEAEQTTFLSRPPPRLSLEFKRPEDAIWLEERVASEQLEANQIVFDAKPHRWHKVLAPRRTTLISSVSAYNEAVKRREQKKLKPSRSTEPNFDFFDFQSFDGSLLAPRGQRACFRVSTLTYERALAIANAILFSAEARGCFVDFDDDYMRFQIHMEREVFSFTIRERQTSEVTLIDENHSYWGTHKVGVPTDKLALVLERRFGGGFELLDKEGCPLQNQLNELFVRLYRSAVDSREKLRRYEKEANELAVQRAAEVAVKHQRELTAALQAEEAKRQDALLLQTASWQQAQQIRAYVADVINQANSPPAPELKAWEAWALQVAADKDPVPGRLAALRSSTTNNGSDRGQEEN